MVLGITEVTFLTECNSFCHFEVSWKSPTFGAVIDSFREILFNNWLTAFKKFPADTILLGTPLVFHFLLIRATSSGLVSEKHIVFSNHGISMPCCGLGSFLESWGPMEVKSSFSLLISASILRRCFFLV